MYHLSAFIKKENEKKEVMYRLARTTICCIVGQFEKSGDKHMIK